MSHGARTEHGKDVLRIAQLVLTAFVDGLTAAETVERIGCSRTTVWKYRVFLGLETGRWASRKPAGRLSTRARLLEVRP